MPYLPLYDKLRGKELSCLLEDLSKKLYPNDEIGKFADRFVDLYNMNSGFFHAPYGTVSGCITELYTKYGKDFVDQIPDNLSNIATTLKDMIEREDNGSPKKAQYTQTYTSIIDLQDYVAMEVIRVDQVARQFERAVKQADTALDDAKKLNKATIELSENIKQINTDATQTLTDAQKAGEEAKNLRSEVISILAIFAAIIIAFTGSLTVLGGVITAVTKAQLYQLLLVAIVCIWGLFNTIYLLLCVVSRLSGKNLSMDCKKGDCTKCDDREKCRGFLRFTRQSPYVVGFNVLIIIMCGAIILLNNLGVWG